MKLLVLSRGKVSQVDDDVFQWASRHRWVAKKQKYTWYAARYLRGKYCYLHNLVLCTPTGFEGNHKNGDGLNNQRSNLQVATHAQNQQAFKTLPKNKTSPYRGVSWHVQSNKWLARIHVNRKPVYLGIFSSGKAAALRYDAAAREFFGVFAHPNFS